MTAAPAPSAPRTNDPENLSGLLDRIVEAADDPVHCADGRISIREILGHVGRRSYGPLLLFIGLFSISPATIVPGMTWLAATMALLVAGQMALGRHCIWLPRKALDASLKRAKCAQASRRSAPRRAELTAS